MKDFNFTSKYCEVNNLRVHYIDEGPEDSPIIFLLHGVPTWSFIYRNVIPICLERGYRVIAPDIPGFGLSDIPEDKNFYNYSSISNYIQEFISIINIDRIVFFGQDWGAIIGMCLAAQIPQKFNGFVFSNGLLPMPHMVLPFKLKLWKLFTKYSPFLPIGRVVEYGSVSTVTKDTRKAYNYPFRDGKSKIAVRRFPQLIYSNFRKNPEMEYVENVWNKLKTLKIPVLTVFSDSDPITKGGAKIIQSYIPGSKGQNHRIIHGGHFVQEDSPQELGNTIIEFALRLRSGQNQRSK